MRNKEYDFTLLLNAESKNEKFVRSVISAYMLDLNPTIEEIADVKTAISEAVTNAVVHAYEMKGGDLEVSAKILGKELIILIKDYGMGIKNIEEARQPFYTTKPDEERSGMGFTVMETFMDELKIFNNQEKGLSVVMKKRIGGNN